MEARNLAHLTIKSHFTILLYVIKPLSYDEKCNFFAIRGLLNKLLLTISLIGTICNGRRKERKTSKLTIYKTCLICPFVTSVLATYVYDVSNKCCTLKNICMFPII